ncbi:MAG: IS1595 family transposase [Algicola sp.]|nr:IS1595 family transposase [Algicola sp.]
MSRSSKTLIAGIDYPKTWSQFVDWFHDDQSCLQYLEKLRWPNGFVCPRCSNKDNPYLLSRGRIMCHSCRYQCTVTSGTTFEKTRTPLNSWFAAVWYITNQKNGVSALGLKDLLGLGSYQTAWTMLHKLRKAMVDPEREKLTGIVEVDETYIGGRDTGNVRAPNPESKKAIVIIAVEILEPKGFGRVRLKRIDSTSKNYVEQFISETIASGSVVRTDGNPVYGSIYEKGYTRDKIVLLGAAEAAHISLPGVHRVASLLKRWLLGTHQGSVKSIQLDAYLDEYAFRFNRRKSRFRGLLFYRLLEMAVATKSVTYKDISNG